MSSNLAKDTASLAINNVDNSIPKNISNKIKIAAVEQVFVWVMKNKKSVNKFILILEENGFKNIILDSEGKTITAQSGTYIVTPDDSCTLTGYLTERGCSVYSKNVCGNYYTSCSSGGIQCKWDSQSVAGCYDLGCSTCTFNDR